MIILCVEKSWNKKFTNYIMDIEFFENRPMRFGNYCSDDFYLLFEFLENKVFKNLSILTKYRKNIENIYKNNLTKQLCKKYLNEDIKSIIENYL